MPSVRPHPAQCPSSEAGLCPPDRRHHPWAWPDPADVCAAIRYLLDAPAVTGQMLAVDGGQHLIWQTPDVQVTE